MGGTSALVTSNQKDSNKSFQTALQIIPVVILTEWAVHLQFSGD